MDPSQCSELAIWEITLHVHKLVNEHGRLTGSLTYGILRLERTRQHFDYILVMIHWDYRVMKDMP